MTALGIVLAYGVLSLVVGLFVSAFIKAGAARQPTPPEDSTLSLQPLDQSEGDHKPRNVETRRDVTEFMATGPQEARDRTHSPVFALLKMRVVGMARNRPRN
jgi:hypothetical protein